MESPNNLYPEKSSILSFVMVQKETGRSAPVPSSLQTSLSGGTSINSITFSIGLQLHLKLDALLEKLRRPKSSFSGASLIPLARFRDKTENL